jgi:hypothetical protein
VELDVVRVKAGPNVCPVDKGIDLTVEFSLSADVFGYWTIQASYLGALQSARSSRRRNRITLAFPFAASCTIAVYR